MVCTKLVAISKQRKDNESHYESLSSFVDEGCSCGLGKPGGGGCGGCGVVIFGIP